MNANMHRKFLRAIKRIYLTIFMLILASAVPGVAIAWFSMRALGLEAVALALATAFFGMVLGVALFAMWIAIGRALKMIK